MNFIPKIEYTELGTGLPKTIIFDSPPEGDPFRERFRPNARSRRANAGVRQTQWNFNLQQYKLEFLFQTQTTEDAFRDFFLNHASRGGSFKYFIHSDEVGFETFEMQSKNYSPRRPIPSAVLGEFEYDISLTIERVV